MKKFLLITASALIVNSLMAQYQYPPTSKGNVVDDYFGTKIPDPYRWLEDDTSARTAGWVKMQQNFTDNYFEKIPYRNKIVDRLSEVWNYTRYSPPYKEGKYYLYYKNDGLQNQAVLYLESNLNGQAQVLLDPNKLSQDGTVALAATAMSKNQKYFAYAVSASGSDWQEIYVISMDSRQVLVHEKIENVKFTSMSWKGDDGFYYSGYDAPKDAATKFSAKTEYQKIYFHKMGTSQKEDKLIYEDKAHPLRYVGASLTEDERFLILGISEGTDGSEIKVKDLTKGGDFVTIVPGFKTNADVIDNVGDKLLVKTNEGAPNYKIVLLDPKNPKATAWKTIVPEQKEPLAGVGTGGGKLFCNYLVNATTKIVQYNTDGSGKKEVKMPGLGTISGFGAKAIDTEFYYSFTSFTTPSTIYKYDIASGESKLYRKSEIKFNSEDYQTKQVFVPSKDGTMVPMFITHRKDLIIDGNNPTLLYAYGGFNISLTPSFSVANIAFLENGGIYCLANLRGGAEYGEDWHKGGMLEKKQNVFDDFIACGEWLIQHNYTNPKRLAIRGGSNGGLLVGACMTQRPDLFAVAIPQVGVLDMLRYHKFTVGWGWAVEYGSSDKKDQFQYLIKYSPLHNLKPGICYPATLITTADHDDRVVPAHSFKFAAALQSFQQCEKPALIRIDSKAGHGAGKPTKKQIEEAADITSFIFWNMGVNL